MIRQQNGNRNIWKLSLSTVKLSENGMKLIEDVGLEVMPATDTSFIIEEVTQ